MKMSNLKFRTILVPLAVLSISVPMILTITANEYSASLDFALGRGTKHTETVGNVSADKLAFYEHNYKTAEESRAAAMKVAQEVEEKGAVLLKNTNDFLPLAKQAKVTPFGYRYLNPYYGGSGSANIDTSDSSVITPEKALTSTFDVNSTVVEKMRSSEGVTMVCDDGNDPTNLTEYGLNTYNGLEDSCKNTTGIVYLARPGTEGYDLNSTVPYQDGTKTQLELTTYEKDMLSFAESHCEHVVVLLITPEPMMVQNLQNDAKITSILWVGLPGMAGYQGVTRILDGEVNPSGRLPDIWYADFKSDPTWFNHTSTAFSNPVDKGPSCFMNYDEGIYMGYRYYETRYATDNTFSAFGKTTNYDGAVVYPFGYGLHYEKDKVSQTFDSLSYHNGEVTVKGTVKNDSSHEVDEAVEIYYTAPYTKGGIAKASKNLVAFDKVTAEAGKEVPFTITFADEDMASYDHKKIYTDTGSYVLEKGDYTISLGKNSHESFDAKTITVDNDYVYSTKSLKGEAVGKRKQDEQEANNILNFLNQYEAEGNLLTLSRDSFSTTFPKEKTSIPFSEELKTALISFDYKTDSRLGEVEGSLLYHSTDPVSKKDNGLTLSDLRGLDYDDPVWDDLLDQLDYDSDDIKSVITYALYQTSAVKSIGKAETNDNDGTVGLTANWGGNEELAKMFNSKTSKVTSCAYPCAPIQAATFDRNVMDKMGEMISEEGLTNNISGWYAPGLNLHRTPYGGRNFEYYSEDPVLTGEIAASTVSGAFTKGGLYAYIKHFALNETDVDRSSVAVFADEQACRELYFKGFEICVKKAEGELRYYDKGQDAMVTKKVKACRGLMTSMNYIGVQSPTNSYDLLTTLLRGEWGFEGMVETDFTSGTYKSKEVGYRVGNDLWMAVRAADIDLSTPTAKWAARKAIHNICYVVVNSNAYDKVAPGSYVYYDLSPWQITLISIDAVLYTIAAGLVVWMVLRQINEKKHPENYRKENDND